MSFNNLRVTIQDTIKVIWDSEHPTIPMLFENATKEPETSFVMVRIDYGTINQASIGSSNNSHRMIGAIVFILVCPSTETINNYDSYISTLFNFKNNNSINGILLRGFDVHNKSFNGDSSETIITQVFQYDII